MPQKKIVIEPDPILRKESKPVEKVDDELRRLLDDMLETMYFYFTALFYCIR